MLYIHIDVIDVLYLHAGNRVKVGEGAICSCVAGERRCVYVVWYKISNRSICNGVRYKHCSIRLIEKPTLRRNIISDRSYMLINSLKIKIKFVFLNNRSQVRRGRRRRRDSVVRPRATTWTDQTDNLRCR
ncbi:hypothetical protein QE152_g9997 [Popillia japonica]|uniref:Uncharacterized protein n=1 Tax=Popillia japonica TaxID=7064 RepID=A0AAW1LWM0_POPJA